MSKLRELTAEVHKNAERQPFVKELVGGISNHRYATYLYNQMRMYMLLEELADAHDIFDTIPEAKRTLAIHADFCEMWGNKCKKEPMVYPVVEQYAAHLETIADDPAALTAHIYVRHMGDLSGGQMIASRVPGKGLYYQFDCETNDLKDRIRLLLNDSMADEAKICFAYAAQLFKEMHASE